MGKTSDELQDMNLPPEPLEIDEKVIEELKRLSTPHDCPINEEPKPEEIAFNCDEGIAPNPILQVQICESCTKKTECPVGKTRTYCNEECKNKETCDEETKMNCFTKKTLTLYSKNRDFFKRRVIPVIEVIMELPSPMTKEEKLTEIKNHLSQCPTCLIEKTCELKVKFEKMLKESESQTPLSDTLN